MRSGFFELYQEAFEAYQKQGKAGYENWWSKLNYRTDISDDMRFEFESEEDWVHKLVNIYDNLRTQGLV